MLKPNDSDFPTSTDSKQGLTKRELIAAMALQGLLANPNVNEIVGTNSYGYIALQAADELIAQLKQYPEGY